MSKFAVGHGAELWIIAGPNGAGKTTFVKREPIRSLLRHLRTLNADDRTEELLAERGLDFSASAAVLQETFIKAADLTFAETISLLEQGKQICVETVLSTHKYRELVESVLSAGGFYGLIYIALASPDLACERVKARFQLGGHDVPPTKIRERWARSIEHLGWYAKKADTFLAFDNSIPISGNERPTPFATSFSGHLTIHNPDAIREITQSLLAAAND
jgi:predicted ABC-type ATPase